MERNTPAVRIAFVTPGGLDAGGGIGRMTGYIVDCFRGDDRGPACDVIDPRGGGSVWWSPFFLAGAIVRLGERLARHRVDLVHINVSERTSFLRKSAMLMVARLFGCPTVAHLHGASFVEFFEHNPIARALSRWFFNRATGTIVLGSGWRDYLVQRVGVDPAKVHVLYNAVPDIGPGPADRSRGIVPGRPVSLLVLANLSERKGIGTLLAAVRVLKDRGVAFRLTLGGGGDVEAYQKRAAELGVAAQCRFLGWVGRDEAHALIHGADMLLLPSTHEGLPMVILEALSAGLPVVTTPVGSIPEVLRHDDTALLVPIERPDALADAIQRLATDPGLYRRLSEAGRTLYLRRFAIRAYCATLAALYEDIVRTGRPGRSRVWPAGNKAKPIGDTPVP